MRGVVTSTFWIPVIIGSVIVSAYGLSTPDDSTAPTTTQNVTSRPGTPTPGLTTNTTTAIEQTTTNPYRYCPAYCNIYGYLIDRRYCSANEFCCGSRTFRFCCSDPVRELPKYADETTCQHSLWWFYNWKVIVGLLGTVMVVMMFGACIYYCCMGLCRRNETVRRVQRRLRPDSDDNHHLNTISGSTVSDTQSGRRNSFNFDPTNPNAFTPPPYESLPKDPPKYTDIFREGGEENQAFVGDSSGETSGAAASMAAAEDAIASASAGGTNSATEGATAGATAGGTSAGASTSENQTSTAGATSQAPSSSSTEATSRSTRSGRNRTTEASPHSPAPSTSVGDVEAPPPYTRDDPAKGRTSSATSSPTRQDATPAATTDTPSSGRTIQRIEVETRAPASGNQSDNAN